MIKKFEMYLREVFRDFKTIKFLKKPEVMKLFTFVILISSCASILVFFIDFIVKLILKLLIGV